MRILLAILIVLLLVLQYQLWIGRGGLPEVWQLQDRIERQEAENEALRERNEALEAEVQNLREGLEAVEERARSELGLVAPGETFHEVIELDRSLEALQLDAERWPMPVPLEDEDPDEEVGQEVLIPPEETDEDDNG